jgi:hypothetical protein
MLVLAAHLPCAMAMTAAYLHTKASTCANALQLQNLQGLHKQLPGELHKQLLWAQTRSPVAISGGHPPRVLVWVLP